MRADSVEEKAFYDEGGDFIKEQQDAYMAIESTAPVLAQQMIKYLEEHGFDNNYKILSPTASTATIESILLKTFRANGKQVNFTVGDMASNLSIEESMKKKYVKLNALDLPFENSSFDILFDKNGFLASSIISDLLEGRGLCLVVLNEYFRVLKNKGVIFIDAISDKYVYRPLDEEAFFDRGELEYYPQKDLDSSYFQQEWAEIKKSYAKIGLEEHNVLLNGWNSTWSYLQIWLKKHPKLASEIVKRYEFEELGGPVNFLVAITQRGEK